MEDGHFHQCPIFLFPFLVIKPRHHVICSRQPYHLAWQQKRGDISRVSHVQAAHSTALSLIIDGVCARLILKPERSVQPAAACSSRARYLGRARHRGAPGLYPARCGRAMAFEMMGHDWVAATRVHLFVQPGVPPLLFVSEGRWGPEYLPQGWEDWEGGKERAPRPHARPHRSSVQCTLPPACLGWVLCVL